MYLPLGMYDNSFASLPFLFVVGEFLAAFIAIFVAYGPLSIRISRQIWNTKEHRKPIIVFALAAWLSIVARAILIITAWTNIVIPFNPVCHPGQQVFCSSCNIFRKFVWITFQLNSLQIAIFYCLVSKFQSRRFMNRLKLLMVLLVALKVVSLTIVLLPNDTGCIKKIIGFGLSRYMACEPLELNQLDLREHQIAIGTYYTVHFFVIVLLSGILLRRIYKVMHTEDMDHYESPQKFIKMHTAMHAVIRHCILTSFVVLIMIARVTLWLCNLNEVTHSLWLDLAAGLAIFLLFPFADSSYEWHLGRIHRCIFALWRKRHIAAISKAVSPEKFVSVLQLHQNAQSTTPVVLLTIQEDETRTGDELPFSSDHITITSGERKSCDTLDSNPFDIDLDYFHVFADLDSMGVDVSADVPDRPHSGDDKHQNQRLSDPICDKHVNQRLSDPFFEMNHNLAVAPGRESNDSFR